MHRFGLQVADARRLRNKWMTRRYKLDRTDAVAIELAGFGHLRTYTPSANIQPPRSCCTTPGGPAPSTRRAGPTYARTSPISGKTEPAAASNRPSTYQPGLVKP